MESPACDLRTLKLPRLVSEYVLPSKGGSSILNPASKATGGQSLQTNAVNDTDYLLLQLMNGRWFDERQLEAHIADGTEKFRKSNEKKVDVGADEEKDGASAGAGGVGVGDAGDESERLDKFGQWLEDEQKGGKST
jgi:hypothetical protein